MTGLQTDGSNKFTSQLQTTALYPNDTFCDRVQEIQSGESSLKKSTTSCLSMLLEPKMVLLLPLYAASLLCVNMD